MASELSAVIDAALSADPQARRRGEEGLSASEKAPGHLHRLMHCLAVQLLVGGPPSPSALFCAQAMQKALRRAAPAELESCGPELVDALAAAADLHWTAGLTQLGLAAAVAMIRSADLSLLNAFDGDASSTNRSIALSLLTLLAEELHCPATRISTPPERPARVRQALEESAHQTLTKLHGWFEQAATIAGGAGRLQTLEHEAAAAADSAAAVLRAGGAWCICGLVGPSHVATSTLFAHDAASALQHPRISADAADALCAAIDVIVERLQLASSRSSKHASGVGATGRGSARVRATSKPSVGAESDSLDAASNLQANSRKVLEGLRWLLRLLSELHTRLRALDLRSRHVTIVVAHACVAMSSAAEALNCLSGQGHIDLTVHSIVGMLPQPSTANGALAAGTCLSEAALALETMLGQWCELLLVATQQLSADDAAVALDAWVALGECAGRCADDCIHVCSSGRSNGEASAVMSSPATPRDGEHEVHVGEISETLGNGNNSLSVNSSAQRLVGRVVGTVRPVLLNALLCSSLLPADLTSVTEAERTVWIDLREEQRAALRATVFCTSEWRSEQHSARWHDATRSRETCAMTNPPEERNGCGSDVLQLLSQLHELASAALTCAKAPAGALTTCRVTTAVGMGDAPPWAVLEAVFHAASAAAKAVGCEECEPLALLMRIVPTAAEYAASLLTAHGDNHSSSRVSNAKSAGRVLLCSILVLVGAMASWLGSPANSHLVPQLVPMLIWSLSHTEEVPIPWPGAQWALRSKQHHAGAVAILKLATLAPRSTLAMSVSRGITDGTDAERADNPCSLGAATSTSSFEELASVLHSVSALCHPPVDGRVSQKRAGAVPESPLSQESSHVLLQALASLAATAAAQDSTGATRLVRALLQPLCTRLDATLQVLVGTDVSQAAPPVAAAATVAESLIAELLALRALLSRWPAPLRAEGASALAPLSPSLAALLRGVTMSGIPIASSYNPCRFANAACEAAAALIDGFGEYSTPFPPVLAPALAARFDEATSHAISADSSPLRDPGAIVAAAAASRRGVLRVLRSMVLSGNYESDDEAGIAAALVRHVAEVFAVPIKVGSTVAAAAEQSVRADWFSLCAACIESSKACRLLTPSAPFVLDACASIATSRPPRAPAVRVSDGSIAPEDVAGYKQALLLLQNAVPPAPLGQLFRAMMQQTHFIQPTRNVQPLTKITCSRGGTIICCLLVSLSSWAPSWLLGEAASCLWAMRNGHGSTAFANWLGEALAQDDVPRPLSVEAKKAFADQMMQATNWSNFKAALKQLSGGKKKQGDAAR